MLSESDLKDSSQLQVWVPRIRFRRQEAPEVSDVTILSVKLTYKETR